MDKLGSKRGATRNIMKMEKPINQNKGDVIVAKGPGPQLDKQTRPARANKFLY